MNFSTYLWSRCDVKWHDVKTEKPSFCESIYRKDDSKTMFINMEVAVIHFQTGQADGAIVSKKSFLKVLLFLMQKLQIIFWAYTVKVGATVFKKCCLIQYVNKQMGICTPVTFKYHYFVGLMPYFSCLRKQTS